MTSLLSSMTGVAANNKERILFAVEIDAALPFAKRVFKYLRNRFIIAGLITLRRW
ncbi:MAG: hypothetical protein IPO77_06210 [Acidobacteria bacterium]|nr:hypothetical protein [Acidobacteriota bacterium]